MIFKRAHGLTAVALAGVFTISCTTADQRADAHGPEDARNEPVLAAGISGTVVGPTGTGLANAAVVIEDTLIAGFTDTDGAFSFTGLPDGEYLVRVSGAGMKTQFFPVVLSNNKSHPISAELSVNTYFSIAAEDFKKAVPERLAEKQSYLSKLSNAGIEDAPNIVVIFFDDLGYGDLSSYGNALIKTPNIDRVAHEGVKLTEFYSASPVCSPSRAALLTGRYPSRAMSASHVFFPGSHPIATLRKARDMQNALPRDEILLSEVLNAVGYRTALIGKWHLGDEAGHRPNDLGFDTFYGALYSNDMAPFAIYRNTDVEIEPENVDQRDLTENYTREAERLIEQNSDQPLFLYFAHTFPHVPHFASKANSESSEAGLYGDVVEDLDRSVGKVMAAIERSGNGRDTLVVITSDNGADFHGSAGDLRGRKGEVFEGGMRVPMIARWPGKLPAGQVRSGMAMNIDLFPTVLALVGLPLPEDRIVDGENILPLLRGETDSPHDYLFYTTAWDGETVGIREKTYKYLDSLPKMSVNSFHPAPALFRAAADAMLTDLKRDREAHNLIETHPELAQELKSKLEAHRQDLAENPRGWLSPETR